MGEKHYLSSLFVPGSIAIIGATERAPSCGASLVRNLLASGFPGALFAVNPKYRQILGIPCYSKISDIRQRVDLAIIATPDATVASLINDCVEAGVKGILLVSTGIRSDSDEEAGFHEQRALDNARSHSVRIIGPNSLGFARPAHSLNATTAAGKILPGTVAFVSQSGALCSSVLDYARANQIGFSQLVSLGRSSDLDFGDVLDYLAADDATDAILIHIEGVRDTRRFTSALRAAATVKPVIVLKAGRHPQSARAAFAHSGVIAGEDAVFSALLRRCGAVRIDSLSQLYGTLKGLYLHVKPRGNRLAILSNGGGPGILAADRAGDLNIPLGSLSPQTIETIAPLLPMTWSRENPVDLMGALRPEHYGSVLRSLLADPGVDGVIALHSPLADHPPEAFAQEILNIGQRMEKPVICCWLGDDLCQRARDMFIEANLPSLRTPENAVEVFSLISAYYRHQLLLSQAAPPVNDARTPALQTAQGIVSRALSERRTTLFRHEATALLGCFHIPVQAVMLVHDLTEAEQSARTTGYPVSISPNAPLAHSRGRIFWSKDYIPDPPALKSAYEALALTLRQRMPDALSGGICVEPVRSRPYARQVRISAWRDPVFGPVLAFGDWHKDAAYWPDRAIALPPLNTVLARDLMRQTHVYPLLCSADGLPAANIEAVEGLLLRVSELLCEIPALRSLELDPIVVDDRDLVVTCVRLEIGLPPRQQSRYAHMAIHPYPSDLVCAWQHPDGTPLTIRPIKPEDAEMKQSFVRGLTPDSRFRRYMNGGSELPPPLLARLTQIDYHREIALVALRAEGTSTRIVGICRYTGNPDGLGATFAIVLADDHQGCGLGRFLLEKIAFIAQQRGMQYLRGEFLANNEKMRRLAIRLGFTISNLPEDPRLSLGMLYLAKQPAPQ